MTAPATVCTRKPGSVRTSCRCAPCLRLRARMYNLAQLGRLSGSPSREAWEVLVDRVSRGWSAGAIASAAGVPAQTIYGQLERYAVTGHQGPLHHQTARAILTMGRPTEGFVGTLGATRRLQALAAAGWPIEPLTRPGLATVTLYEVRAGRRPTVTVAVHDAVADLYDALAMRPGPSDLARRRALAAGWAPPMAWDDDAMDDPAAVPQGIDGATAAGVDELAVERAVDGIRTDLTSAERDLALPRMASAGMSDPAIARVLGIDVETVYRNRSRLAVPPAVPSSTARARRAS